MTNVMHPNNEQTSASPTENTADGAQETIKVQGGALAAKVKELIHEGNIRRIVVNNEEGHTIMEIPVTAGVIAAIAIPVLTAVGAIAALANDWTIEVERKVPDPQSLS